MTDRVGSRASVRFRAATVILVFGACLSFAVRAGAQSAAPGPRWSFIAGGPIVGSPAIGSGNVIFIAGGDRRLYALDSSGRPLWAFRGAGRFATGPAIGYAGVVYVATVSGAVHALNPGGTERWRTQLDGAPCGELALAEDGAVIVTTCSGSVVALDWRGERQWELRLAARASGSAGIGPDGSIVVGTADRRLHLIRPDGEKSWEMVLPGTPGAAAIAADGTIYVGSSGLRAVSPDGTVLWEYEIAAQVAPPVLGVNGAVIAGSTDGRVQAIGRNGARIWETELGAAVVNPAAVAADGTVYAAAGSALVALGAGGALKWRFQADDPFGAPVITSGGDVLTGSDNWILYVLSGGAEPWPGPWSLARGGHPRTGRVAPVRAGAGPEFLALSELAAAADPLLIDLALRELDAAIGARRPTRLELREIEALLNRAASPRAEIEGRAYAGEAAATESRIRALQLLGHIGSESARRTLIDRLLAETDPEVRAVIAEALGAIGSDPDGATVRAFQRAAAVETGRAAHLGRYISALQAIALANGGFSDPAGYTMLIAVMDDARYRRGIRDYAREVLELAARAAARRSTDSTLGGPVSGSRDLEPDRE